MFALPAATPVTVPLDTVALVLSLDAHVTTASAGTVVAVKLTVDPAATVAVVLSSVTLGVVGSVTVAINRLLGL